MPCGIVSSQLFRGQLLIRAKFGDYEAALKLRDINLQDEMWKYVKEKDPGSKVKCKEPCPKKVMVVYLESLKSKERPVYEGERVLGTSHDASTGEHKWSVSGGIWDQLDKDPVTVGAAIIDWLFNCEYTYRVDIYCIEAGKALGPAVTIGGTGGPDTGGTEACGLKKSVSNLVFDSVKDKNTEKAKRTAKSGAERKFKPKRDAFIQNTIDIVCPTNCPKKVWTIWRDTPPTITHYRHNKGKPDAYTEATAKIRYEFQLFCLVKGRDLEVQRNPEDSSCCKNNGKGKGEGTKKKDGK